MRLGFPFFIPPVHHIKSLNLHLTDHNLYCHMQIRMVSMKLMRGWVTASTFTSDTSPAHHKAAIRQMKHALRAQLGDVQQIFNELSDDIATSG
ncbi:hypothetical protein ACNKHU_04705 [Shigella flexneri]